MTWLLRGKFKKRELLKFRDHSRSNACVSIAGVYIDFIITNQQTIGFT